MSLLAGRVSGTLACGQGCCESIQYCSSSMSRGAGGELGGMFVVTGPEVIGFRYDS